MFENETRTEGTETTGPPTPPCSPLSRDCVFTHLSLSFPCPRSAFFWLLAILLTSLIWLAVPPLQVRKSAGLGLQSGGRAASLYLSVSLISLALSPSLPVHLPPQTAHVFPTVVGVVVQEAVRLLLAFVYAK